MSSPLPGILIVSREKPHNLAACFRQRLFNPAQDRREDFGRVLTKYGLERLLYRLANPFTTITCAERCPSLRILMHRPYRPIRDLDLSGRGEDPLLEWKVFGEVIAQIVEDDGLSSTLNHRINKIKESKERRTASQVLVRLERARIPLQVDIGFGDAIVPAPQEIDIRGYWIFQRPLSELIQERL